MNIVCVFYKQWLRRHKLISKYCMKGQNRTDMRVRHKSTQLRTETILGTKSSVEQHNIERFDLVWP